MGPVALISPGNPFYAYRLRGLARGFLGLGYPCVVHDGIVDHQALATWANQWGASLCLEMNRVRLPVVDWPAAIPHAVWIADYAVDGKNITRDLGVNDHYYFLIHPSAFGIEVS